MLAELDDGRIRVTVAFHDTAAEELWVLGGLAGADPGDRRMRPAGDGWWERTYELPRDVRTLYWFTRAQMPEKSSDFLPDPLNPQTFVYRADPELADDEDITGSLLELPDAPPLTWSREREVARGVVEEHRLRSERLANERRVYTYAPPGYDDRRDYPLVVVFDGYAYVSDSFVPPRRCSTT